MGIPDHLTCLLRNLYAGQEAAVKTGHGTTDWFQIGMYLKIHHNTQVVILRTFSLDILKKKRGMVIFEHSFFTVWRKMF